MQPELEAWQRVVVMKLEPFPMEMGLPGCLEMSSVRIREVLSLSQGLMILTTFESSFGPANFPSLNDSCGMRSLATSLEVLGRMRDRLNYQIPSGNLADGYHPCAKLSGEWKLTLLRDECRLRG